MIHWFVQRWALGAVFLPDSAGYLVAASGLGSPAQRLGPERVAIAAVLCVGCSALIVPHAPSVGWLMFPQAALGGGLGAADAALVPALLAKRSRALPHRAALLQAASSAAYAIVPARSLEVGGASPTYRGEHVKLQTNGAPDERRLMLFVLELPFQFKNRVVTHTILCTILSE
ncbi:jg947 [Pararge aegeria aegeria]|uniref:Jg947 protein n=1 Tax=Pararge aegeria aegeria TaxID=348720 RepID=A0A8S4QJ30_9NEOP|nr:jg947 [Pararge aegeria aegeria]